MFPFPWTPSVFTTSYFTNPPPHFRFNKNWMLLTLIILSVITRDKHCYLSEAHWPSSESGLSSTNGIKKISTRCSYLLRLCKAISPSCICVFCLLNILTTFQARSFKPYATGDHSKLVRLKYIHLVILPTVWEQLYQSVPPECVLTLL
jgi:hypothetical protein